MPISPSLPERHWAKTLSRWWEPAGSEVCNHTHHVHIPCSFCHWWIRLCGEPVFGRCNSAGVHACWKGWTREICTGGEIIIVSQLDAFESLWQFLMLYLLFFCLYFCQVATKTLPFYKEYFSVPYPLPKIDLIAIADFAAGESCSDLNARFETLLL